NVESRGNRHETCPTCLPGGADETGDSGAFDGAAAIWRGDYSSFAPESLTRAAHFGASTAMKAAKSCGDPTLACALNRAKFVLISGDWRASLMAALSLLTIGAGVPAGASTPVLTLNNSPTRCGGVPMVAPKFNFPGLALA